MIKTILYTSNPNFVPMNMDQVVNFAENNDKYLTCLAKEGTELFDVEEGAHIVTGKGNNLYVIETGGDYTFAKKSNITSIMEIDYPFNNVRSDETAVKEAHSVSNFSDRLMQTFMPQEAKDVRISMNGEICVKTPQGYVTIDAQNHLIAYPEELTCADFPMYTMSKPKENLAVGDIISLEKTYAKVTSIKGEKINAISYTGAGKVIRTIKDFLLNQTNVRVVVSPAGNICGQMNPMMLLALSKKKDSSFLLPLMMMSQQGGVMNGNPMMFALLAGKDNASIKDILMMSMASGNNMFKNMFKPTPVEEAPITPDAETPDTKEEFLGD